MLFSMLCPAAYADDGTVSFDTCSHEWETPIRSGYSYTIPNTDVSFGVKVEQCKKCKWYKHVASIIIAEYTYYSPFNVDENGLIPTELATVWANVWYKTFGKNATAEKFTPGGGSTSGSGAGRKDTFPAMRMITVRRLLVLLVHSKLLLMLFTILFIMPIVLLIQVGLPREITLVVMVASIYAVHKIQFMFVVLYTMVRVAA